MESITVRRTINTGGYESLSLEVVGHGDTLELATRDATKKLLEMFRVELYRIYTTKQYNINNNPFDQVSLELQFLSQQESKQ